MKAGAYNRRAAVEGETVCVLLLGLWYVRIVCVVLHPIRGLALGARESEHLGRLAVSRSMPDPCQGEF